MKFSSLKFLSLLITSLSFSSCDSPVSAEISAFIQCFANATFSAYSEQNLDSVIYTDGQGSSFSSILDAHIRNLRFATPDTPKPSVIVTPFAPNHVQATVICAKEHSLQIRIRSGGHDYEGVSYVSHVPFVLLDMFNLRDVSIDMETETAWVQSGATLGELFYKIAQNSKVHAFPAGICPTVGAGGHFSGGGYGNLMRIYGLSIDHILDATLVDVKGRILNRKAMGEDLFWAIRGGGAASFGVVLSWKINLVRVPVTVTVFNVVKTLEQGATDAVDQWQQLAAEDKLDREIFIRVILRTVNNTLEASFYGMLLGDSKTLLEVLHRDFPLLGLRTEYCIETSWLKSVLFWYEVPHTTSEELLLSRLPLTFSYLKRKSDYVKSPIPRSGLEAIWKKMIELEGTVRMLFNPYGGRMAEISPTETPFPHRAGNLWKIQYSANWDEAEDSHRHLDGVRQLYEFMTPYVSKSPRDSFLNYRDLDIGTNSKGEMDFGYKYFKGNFERLVRVKTAVDPDNFFTNEQSIPTQSQLIQDHCRLKLKYCHCSNPRMITWTADKLKTILCIRADDFELRWNCREARPPPGYAPIWLQ